jgi:hypothetical protein
MLIIAQNPIIICIFVLTKQRNHLKHTIMKTEITKTENIEVTEFTMEANVIILDSVPTVEKQNELFGTDDSIVLEF